MRVHDPNLNGAAAAQTGGAREVHGAGRSGAARTPGTAPGGDRVELSDTLGALSRSLAAYDADRTARVQELAAQYSRGEYRADSAAISRAMVSDAIGAGSA
jgi:flagellar biosynthesis anti-sigma factor FlgM